MAIYLEDNVLFSDPLEFNLNRILPYISIHPFCALFGLYHCEFILTETLAQKRIAVSVN